MRFSGKHILGRHFGRTVGICESILWDKSLNDLTGSLPPEEVWSYFPLRECSTCMEVVVDLNASFSLSSNMTIACIEMVFSRGNVIYDFKDLYRTRCGSEISDY